MPLRCLPCPEPQLTNDRAGGARRPARAVGLVILDDAAFEHGGHHEDGFTPRRRATTFFEQACPHHRFGFGCRGSVFGIHQVSLVYEPARVRGGLVPLVIEGGIRGTAECRVKGNPRDFAPDLVALRQFGVYAVMGSASAAEVQTAIRFEFSIEGGFEPHAKGVAVERHAASGEPGKPVVSATSSEVELGGGISDECDLLHGVNPFRLSAFDTQSVLQ